MTLRRWNALPACAHAAQGVAILLLANGTSIPITWTFVDGRPASGAATTTTLVELPFGPAKSALAWQVFARALA